MFHRLLHFLPAIKSCIILRMVYPIQNMEQVGVEKLYVVFWLNIYYLLLRREKLIAPADNRTTVLSHPAHRLLAVITPSWLLALIFLGV